MRECGECIVCCVYPRINDPELTKRGMQHCPNLTLPGEEVENSVFYTGATNHNCKIHSTRPKMCRDYRCVWLLGHGHKNDRPDKSLMLFDNSSGIENTIQAKPLKDNQENSKEGMRAVENMSKSLNLPVIVVNFYERKIQRIVGRGL